MEILEDCVIAVQNKGRLTEQSLGWLNESYGTSFDVEQKPFDQTRELYDEATGITVFGCSNGELFKVVAMGIADYGIGGKDKFYESTLKFRAEQSPSVASISPIADLGFAACRILYADKTEPDRRVERVAAAYPYIGKAYLKDADVAVDYFSGGVESIARRGGYGAVIDVSETGGSLTLNGWTPRSVVLDSEAMLFTSGQGWSDVPVSSSPPALPVSAEAVAATQLPLLDVAGYLASLETITGRAIALQNGELPRSYTQKLLADQNERIKKLGSETVELVREECRPDFDEAKFTGELADLVYAAEVIAAARGVPFVAALNELALRNR